MLRIRRGQIWSRRYGPQEQVTVIAIGKGVSDGENGPVMIAGKKGPVQMQANSLRVAYQLIGHPADESGGSSSPEESPRGTPA